MVKKNAVLVLVPFLFLWRSVTLIRRRRIRTGYGSVSIQSGLVWIAKQKGLFAKYGLSPEIIYIPGGSATSWRLLCGVTSLAGH